ncbi:MAG: hypothetical protein ABIL58_06430 [Pseudomonadota bacterium]
MRHKFIIRITENMTDLFISEQAEVDKGLFSALCEEKFALDTLKTAAAEGDAALMGALRSVNFYPPLEYANQIAVVVQEMLSGRAPERRELLIDDRQVMAAEEAELEALAVEEALPPDTEDLDDLLEDDASPAIDPLKDDVDDDAESN